MDASEKKKAAAVAAVYAYIRNQEEVTRMNAMAAMQPPFPQAGAQAPPPSRISPWGASGRQDQMQLRSMMQLKAFHGWRPR